MTNISIITFVYSDMFDAVVVCKYLLFTPLYYVFIKEWLLWRLRFQTKVWSFYLKRYDEGYKYVHIWSFVSYFNSKVLIIEH